MASPASNFLSSRVEPRLSHPVGAHDMTCCACRAYSTQGNTTVIRCGDSDFSASSMISNCGSTWHQEFC